MEIFPEFLDKSGRFREDLYRVFKTVPRKFRSVRVSIEMNGETFIVDSRINCTLVVG